MLKVFCNIKTKTVPTSDAETLLVEMNNIPGKCDMTLPFFYIVSVA